MEFEDILVYIKQGRKAKRRLWDGKLIHLGIGTLGSKTLVMESLGGSFGTYLATNADILAIDWELLPEETKVERGTNLTAKELTS